MENQYDDEIEIDLRELFFEIKKKLWLILLAAIAGAGIAGAFSKLVLKPVYSSTSMIYVLSKETTLTSLADLQIGSQLTKDYRVLVASRPVLEPVIESLGLEMDYEQLKRKITISNPSDTRLLTLTVEDTDPMMAKTIVDKVTDRASVYIGEIMEMQPPKIIEKGQIPTRPTSPNVKKNTLMGGVLGGFLVCAAVVLVVIMNDTVQTEDDVEKYLGLSTLAVIPNRNESSAGRKRNRQRKNRKGNREND